MGKLFLPHSDALFSLEEGEKYGVPLVGAAWRLLSCCVWQQ
jgi:hypothetical protein